MKPRKQCRENTLDINMTLLGQSIAMLVFVWFCMKFIWPPLMNAIEERQTQIADGLAAAERGQQSLDKAQAEAGDIVDDARKQATSILDQAHARANEIVVEGKADGTKERDRLVAAASAEVEQETNRAREELRGQVSAIAVASAEKILRREIDKKTHEDILSKLAAEL
jgi:F-type H+-transporting ATPase subunit b